MREQTQTWKVRPCVESSVSLVDLLQAACTGRRAHRRGIAQREDGRGAFSSVRPKTKRARADSRSGVDVPLVYPGRPHSSAARLHALTRRGGRASVGWSARCSLVRASSTSSGATRAGLRASARSARRCAGAAGRARAWREARRAGSALLRARGACTRPERVSPARQQQQPQQRRAFIARYGSVLCIHLRTLSVPCPHASLSVVHFDSRLTPVQVEQG